jgi:hypothetical protein
MTAQNFEFMLSKEKKKKKKTLEEGRRCTY